MVERLQRAEPVDLNAETRPIGIRDRDEIGQVARAFDAVHSTAVRVAAEQAALRRSVADMFLSLGRRLQALVHRQLELLDELERTEADPQQLRSLFQLDHLATRMRRNAENLLVLSGAEPVRRWSDPVPLPRVIRAASAEIEDYNRVGVMPMADVRVVGHAVSDVIHLLAELIENAAAFSPPGTRVQVAGEPAAHGYLLEIEDQGIGMSDEELAEANEQLAKPASIDLASAQRLGFYVVGRLAARHGIKVRLRRSWFGGVAALVLLPSSLLGGPETEMEPAGPAPAGPPGSRWSSRPGPSRCRRRCRGRSPSGPRGGARQWHGRIASGHDQGDRSMTGPFEADPGPFLRPYAMTEGRTEPTGRDLAIEDLIGAAAAAARLAQPRAPLDRPGLPRDPVGGRAGRPGRPPPRRHPGPRRRPRHPRRGHRPPRPQPRRRPQRGPARTGPARPPAALGRTRGSVQAGSARPACSIAASMRSTGPSMALAVARVARRSRSGGGGR